MDRGAWRGTVHRVEKSQPQLSTYTWMHMYSVHFKAFFPFLPKMKNLRHKGNVSAVALGASLGVDLLFFLVMA